MDRKFVNSWVLAKDLPRIAEASGDPDVARLCRILEDNIVESVDTVLVSSELELLGHRNVNEAVDQGAASYRRLLEQALGKGQSASPGKVSEASSKPNKVVLTQETPEGRLLDVFRVDEDAGRSISTLYPIDLQSFAQGGTLELKVTVGGSDASATFELCEVRQPTPDEFVFAGLKALRGVPPGTTRTIVHDFSKGQVLHLGVHGKGDDGTVNAFLVEARVVQDS